MAARRAMYELFIQRIPFTAGSRELREYFTQFGSVGRCSIKLDMKTGFLQGFGWVSFHEESSFQDALRKEDHRLDGYKIHVQKQKTRRDDEEEM